MLKRNSINFHCKFGARQKWEPPNCIGDLEIFWTVSLKAHDWSSWILKNCEMPYSVRGLYDKKYCFTSDVMYKKYKRLVYTPPDLLARFCKVNLSKAKNSAWFVFQEFVFQALSTVIKSHYGSWVRSKMLAIFWVYTYGYELDVRCFTLKSLSLKSHMNLLLS